MKRNNEKRNFKSKKLNNSLITSGLGLFLLFGFTGCNNTSEECKNLNMLSQAKIDECNKMKNSGSSTTSFIPFYNNYTNSNSYSTNPNSNYFKSNSNSNSSKSSGFFSHTSSNSSSIGG